MSTASGMVPMLEVVQTKHDQTGKPIERFYARKVPEYLVYSACDPICGHVMINFADDEAIACWQRRELSPLLPLRDEIEGLTRGWRDAKGTGFFGLRDAGALQHKARCQDSRVGAALAVALEGDVPGAQVQLEKIKSDIVNERVAWARFEYLLTAFLMSLSVMFAAWALSSLLTNTAPADRHERIGVILLLLLALGGAGVALAARLTAPWRTTLLFAAVAITVGSVLMLPGTSWDDVRPGYEPGVKMWRGAAAGTVGAFFSIAIAIKGRTILPDLLRTANMMDAVLRVTVGAIGGAVVIALFHGGLVTFAGMTEQTPLFVLIAGFFAGFSERLVPDLLAKATEKPFDYDAKVAAARAARNVRHAMTAPPGPAAGGPVAGGPTPPPANDNPDDDDVEVGADGFQLNDDEVTQDDELPPAAGGVAPAA